MRPQLVGTFGMVSSTHWLASASGMAALEEGGNAFDAAVAAGLALQVVEPHNNGLGGEAPSIFYSADTGVVRVVNAQGPAPHAATIDRFSELGLDMVPGTGLLAACVPAAFDGWMVLARHGRLPLGRLMRFAISYADGGYPVAQELADEISLVEDTLASHWPDSAALYLPSKRPPGPGTMLRNPALAATYKRILREAEAAGRDRDAQIEAARDAFYRGFVADAIDRFVARSRVWDGAREPHSGWLSAEDLSRYRAGYEDPITFAYGGLEVHKTGPWGQGPVFLQQLALLEGFDLSTMDPRGPEFIHTVMECAKLAFADREAWYGDPAFVDVPLGSLLAGAYSDSRRGLVGQQASLDLRPGSVDGRTPRLPAAVYAPDALHHPQASSSPSVRTHAGDTCHLDVVDKDGNLVSATPSGGWLQGSPVIPELGFALTTRAQMFWLEEGLPGSLAPGKRPRTTLSPSLATRDGDPYLAFGTPGGDCQDQWPLLFFLHHVHFSSDLQLAIDAPTFHTTHFPSSFFPREQRPGELVIEATFEESTRRALAQRGHRVTVAPAYSLGRTTAVARDHRTGLLFGAANGRGKQAYAAGR
jgi:gamma-glutamyltranspeptidase / glutathione hydrolase